MQAGRDWFLANNKMLRQVAHHRSVLTRTQTLRSAKTWTADELEPGFRAMDRSLSRRPRGDCEARVRRGTRQCGTGASKRVRATTTAAGWPHDFSGAFGREARALCVALGGG